MTVQMNVDVRDTASAGLRALMLRTGSISECLDSIGGSLVTSTQQRFEDEQDPRGNTWKEHSEATRAKRGTGARILFDQGDLAEITHQVQGSKVLVGTNRIYGRIQQLGGEAGRKTARVVIPARPYLGISGDDEREIGAIVTDHLRMAA
jgi:phage virion morphogenesis protein